MGQVMKIERSYIHTQNRLLSLMSVTEPLEKSMTQVSNELQQKDILPSVNGSHEDGRGSNSSGDMETETKKEEEKKE